MVKLTTTNSVYTSLEVVQGLFPVILLPVTMDRLDFEVPQGKVTGHIISSVGEGWGLIKKTVVSHR
jgi:hypothetical protein